MTYLRLWCRRFDITVIAVATYSMTFIDYVQYLGQVRTE